ncbi:hypothetical protein [Phenylobacterium sp.]|uniref:hypothetical protein n=1 Tax=Phenylobacterium sp. TaxID=1871053 RepID=UPI00273071FB|nr:hypothetical protein [Phenylobacterium sp.]MDP2214777.1 hypothetical protein [Phenylobacterium sp.]
MSDIFVTILDGVARQVSAGASFQSTAPDGSRLTHVAGSLPAYSEADQAAFGIFRIPLPEPPDGQVEVERTLVVEDGEPSLTVTFAPAPPPPVPTAVDMRQARLKLLDEPHGDGSRLDAVEAYVASQGRKVQIEWLHARELRRDHPLVGIMGVFFEQTSEDIDQWFREAAAIGPTLAA